MTRGQLRIVDEGILSHDASRGAFMPSVTAVDDGTWIACQHVGRELGSADNCIEVLRSTDARKWHNQGCMHELDPRWAYRGPDIEQLPDGRLVMTATRFEVNDTQLFDPDSEGLQRPEMLVFWSSDQGASWSPPQIVPVDLPAEKYTWNKAGRLMQCSPTRWLYPFETWKPAEYDGPPDQKAAAVVSADQGQTWAELTVMADDPSGKLLWWDQMNARLPDGRWFVMLWTHRYGTKEDLTNHWIISDDEGRSWSEPQPTNLPGQVCCPIALPDGRVAAIYNYRKPPQGIRVALCDDFSSFDREREIVVFDPGAEATFGHTHHENFLAEHMLIAFGKPQGICLADGSLLTFFWCTSQGVTHTRWVRLSVE